MPDEKTIGKPDAGNPHVRFERGPQETELQSHRAWGLPPDENPYTAPETTSRGPGSRRPFPLLNAVIAVTSATLFGIPTAMLYFWLAVSRNPMPLIVGVFLAGSIAIGLLLILYGMHRAGASVGLVGAVLAALIFLLSLSTLL